MSSGHEAIPSSFLLCGIFFLNINSLSLADTGLNYCVSFTLSSLACLLSYLEKVSSSLLAVGRATDKGVLHHHWGSPWKQERLLFTLSSCWQPPVSCVHSLFSSLSRFLAPHPCKLLPLWKFPSLAHGRANMDSFSHCLLHCHFPSLWFSFIFILLCFLRLLF